MAVSLEQLLGSAMAEKSGHAFAGATANFKSIVQESPAFAKEAADRLNFLAGPNGDGILLRDHVSRMHKLILEEVLNV